jgi:Ca-activated chloride channel family protein
MDRFYQRVNYPALTDVEIDWGSMKVNEQYPKRLPDVFVGRPMILTGRFDGKVPSAIRVSGQAANEPVVLNLNTRAGDGSMKHSGLPSVWARLKISDVSDQALLRPKKELSEEIKQVALEYGLLSDFTAFVAVDSIIKREPGVSVTVPVESPVPEGVKPETTVKDQ